MTACRTMVHGVILSCALLSACGKKGAPLPPLVRAPAAPPDFVVARLDQDVYVQLKAPSVNVDGAGPADVARVELYAVTADRAPQLASPEALRRASTLVASEAVRRPLPPPPAVAEGQPPPPPPPPPGPGVDQGAPIVFREVLTAEARVPVSLPQSDRAATAQTAREAEVPRPLVAPAEVSGPQRYYFAVGVSPRGRYGPPTAIVPAPLGPTSSAPGKPELTVEETKMTLKWTAPPDARGVEASAEADVLPSRSIVPGPPPTTYDVYEVPREPASGNASPARPVPLAEAIAAREFTRSDVALGSERCFVVRAVDIVSGVHVRGPASEPVCAPFADTYPPKPASNLEAIASSGVIALLWEGSDAKDLDGYLVLRAEAGNATLAALTPAPVTVTTYRDETAKPGVRYVYAVVAVDKAGNRSPESNRVEETGR